MRRSAALFFASLAFASLAHADVFDFSLKGTYITDTPQTPYADEFTLDTSLVIPSPWPEFNRICPDCFTTTRPGGYYVVARSGIVDLIASGGDPLRPLEAFYLSDPTKPTGFLNLYNGPSTHPVLTTGKYAFEMSNSHGDVDGQVTITDLTTRPVPEPSTLALLTTGVLGLAGTLRRRLA